MQEVDSRRPGSCQLDYNVGTYLLYGGELNLLCQSVQDHYVSLENWRRRSRLPRLPLVASRRSLVDDSCMPSSDVRSYRPMPGADLLNKMLRESRAFLALEHEKNAQNPHLVFAARIISALIVGDDDIFIQRLRGMSTDNKLFFMTCLSKAPGLRSAFYQAVQHAAKSGDADKVKTLIDQFSTDLMRYNSHQLPDSHQLPGDMIATFDTLLDSLGQPPVRTQLPQTPSSALQPGVTLWSLPRDHLPGVGEADAVSNEPSYHG